MNTREKFLQVVRGGEFEGKLRLSFDEDSDAILNLSQAELSRAVNGEKPVLQVIAGPFLRAHKEGQDLNDAYRSNPQIGAEVAEKFVNAAESEIQEALDQGADGIVYLLEGARGAFSTPMEYGGYHLENDRRLLELVTESTLSAVYVIGHEDLYIDFVSDLPAHLFAWDANGSTYSSDYVRTLRTGAQASNDPDSEVFFDINPVIQERISHSLELTPIVPMNLPTSLTEQKHEVHV